MNPPHQNLGRTRNGVGLFLALAILPLLFTVTGCRNLERSDLPSASTSIDDADTTARVQAALTNDQPYSYPNVNVTTRQGAVQLTGFVSTPDQRKRAGQLALGVEGVILVSNYLTIKN